MKKMIWFITTILAVNTLITTEALAQSDTSPPMIGSEAAIMIDSKTGTVLYDKNANQKMYPASLTKIAAAIYAIETGNLEDVVTVSQKARNTVGTRVYLEEGEQVSLKKLIQGLLVNSGNDAGVAIAEHLSGSVERFSADLNQYLKNVIGVANTNFENPHGLFHPNHVTTAKDLTKITQYAMKNEVFRKIFGTEELKWNGESWDTTLYTHHKLMRQKGYEWITGGKTGYVDQSGFTLATTAEKEGLSVILITLNSDSQADAYNDTIKLLNYGFEHFKTESISKGATFTVDGKEYKASKRLLFTQRVNEKVSKKIKKDGTLEIVNQDGTVLTSFQLDKVKKEKSMDVQTSTAPKNVEAGLAIGPNLPKLLFVAISIVLSIVLSIVGLFYRHLRNT
ncbi:D-alanyl-D-alanine carboxypeptidase [Halobacillus shinanisalinarum]|uniref:D-alanyl-D-alanine carboxypeptidase n=1 Tax=Halobacillus shinanisalinarum TaxID=2932258 RepID=A0ABY4H1I6_9BACI|nr:D-alanyl-D-alanine carboxypeptidase family protein [Halobacillus shinanisalinarum]UOQ94019.1 D-alanyl-D-alanine carboxypeptidase [Halobacillus shinanisalinarum]